MAPSPKRQSKQVMRHRNDAVTCHIRRSKLDVTELKQKLTSGVDSARRVLDILFMFNEDKLELTVEDISREHDISLPSAYRYISLLREQHLVQSGSGGGITLAPRVIELAAAAEQSLNLDGMAKPILDELMQETDETAFIMKRYRSEAVFVIASQPDRALTLSFRSGKSMPLTRGAVAKVLLAFSPNGFRERYLQQLPMYKAQTAVLAAELEQIVAQGYAVSEAEVDEGIWGCAVPLRIGDAVVASLSIAGPAFRINDEKRLMIRDRLIRGAAKISSQSNRL